MVYVMSDLHGCYTAFLEMLGKINFSDSDTLFILGDLVDRGNENVKLVFDLMERKNVIALKGNHDDMAATFFGRHMAKLADDKLFAIEDEEAWLHNGRQYTYREFHRLKRPEKEQFVAYLAGLPLRKIIRVGERKYHLSHTVPDKALMTSGEEIPEREYLWGEPEFEQKYFKTTKLIVGHTPTSFIRVGSSAVIYQKNNLIDVDCGVSFGGRLGCLRLDDGKEFYVE